MTDTVLKFRGAPEGATGTRRASLLGMLLGMLRKRLRLILLVIVPSLALVAGLAFYLAGGRTVSTDNAYVGAQKVLVTPDISGKIAAVRVKEGQRVVAGDVLFEIDPTPFRLALSQAQSKLDSVRTDFNNMKSNLKSLNTLVDLAGQNVALKQKDVERKATLLAKSSGAQADLDNSMSATVTARLQAQLAVQQQATTLNAPIAGPATQVDNIQLGRFVTAGTPILSVIDDGAPWVDANPKETDLTHVRVGQKATIDVDAFPDVTFHGPVSSISPGTGAQFAILPPQNAIGNWVKVVQRVPLRIAFDPGQDLTLLRAGMSVTVDIDTGQRRSLWGLVGLKSAASTGAPP